MSMGSLMPSRPRRRAGRRGSGRRGAARGAWPRPTRASRPWHAARGAWPRAGGPDRAAPRRPRGSRRTAPARGRAEYSPHQLQVAPANLRLVGVGRETQLLKGIVHELGSLLCFGFGFLPGDGRLGKLRPKYGPGSSKSSSSSSSSSSSNEPNMSIIDRDRPRRKGDPPKPPRKPSGPLVNSPRTVICCLIRGIRRV